MARVLFRVRHARVVPLVRTRVVFGSTALPPSSPTFPSRAIRFASSARSLPAAVAAVGAGPLGGGRVREPVAGP